ncbi:MAG: carboxylesterase family protein [Bacteroidales bacterium]
MKTRKILIQGLFALLMPVAYFATGCKDAGKKIDVNKVKTEAGFVKGKTVENGIVKVFMGIPFAAPPVDSLRWKPPQPVPHWKGVRECLTAPPSAMQSKPVPFMMWSKEFMAPEEPLSEDCLYLNIWTSAENTGEKRPVIVWIHGGGFTGGSGTVPLYNGEEMAKKGVVFITINYRLGVFGFLAHPELSAESPAKVSGNYGILDQIEALKWVKNNIMSFGGDPDNVTIAGQSAGAFSVNALVVSPLAKGLFHRAIAHSGGMFSRFGGLVNDLETAESSGKRYVEQLNVSSIEELRKKPAEELIKVPGRWGVVFDGYVVLPARQAYETGMFNDVPLISGWNADDGVSMGVNITAEMFRQNAKKQYGEIANEFLKYFPAGDDNQAQKSQKLASVLSFGWQNYFWAKAQSEKGKNKAYLYYFTHVPPGEPNYGAFHSAEFGYALKTLKFWNRPFTDTDYNLSEKMSSYWINFATTGNPNGTNLPEWPWFNPENPQVMEFGDAVKVIPLPFREQLEFFNRVNK